MRSIKPFPPARLAHCVFEHVYFARPDSYVFGKSVNEVRTELGRHPGARSSPWTPTSSCRFPTRASARRSVTPRRRGIPMRMGLIRNHYVGRTFIEPQQSIRHFGVRVKLNPVRSILEGKRVVLVDDSIVRGTTSRKIVKMVRARRRDGSAHAHQLSADDFAVLLRCRHAAAIELIAATHTLEEIRQVHRRGQRSATSASTACSGAVGRRRRRYCTSCYTGEYPVAFPRDEAAYLQLALKLEHGTQRSGEPVIHATTLAVSCVRAARWRIGDPSRFLGRTHR